MYLLTGDPTETCLPPNLQGMIQFELNLSAKMCADVLKVYLKLILACSTGYTVNFRCFCLAQVLPKIFPKVTKRSLKLVQNQN